MNYVERFVDRKLRRLAWEFTIFEKDFSSKK